MPPKKPLKKLGKNGYKYREQYGVIIVCDDESHQQTLFNNLKKQGHKCRVVTV